MKKITALILAILSLTLAACTSLWGFGNEMPDWGEYKAFENDRWLIINHMLINKKDGTVSRMAENKEAELPKGIWYFYCHEPYVYKYEFGDDSFKEYTFLLSRENDFHDVLYYECVLTYGYDGNEISREYIGEALTKEKMKKAYINNPSNVGHFSFEVDVHGPYCTKEYDKGENKAVMNYAEDLYEAQKDEFSTVSGLAKPMAEELWFAVTVSDETHYNSGEPLFEGIFRSSIMAYNSESDEFKTIYDCNDRGKQIVDFDENGFYTIDSKGRFSYIDYETNESTLIYDFSERVYSFDITDEYICATHGKSGSEYFVYKKSGAVVANDIF